MLARWRARDVVEEAQRLRKDAEPWIFYEGPPTANGRPGLHHVWARVFKDLYPRFQTMRGHDVPRKGGWDCHGLPVELEVEKELGLTNKHEIEAYGVAEFNQRCRDSVPRYVEDWSALTARSGVWIDTADAYWTLSNDYVESVWWLIRQMWDKGLLYEGHRVTPYCARCGTALVEPRGRPGLPRRRRPVGLRALPAHRRRPDRRRPARVDDHAVDARSRTSPPPSVPTSTTCSCRGAAPRPRPGARGAAVDRLLRRGRGEVVARFTGRDLVGWHYERPFTDLPLDDADGGGSSPPTTSAPTTAPASSTWRPPSARTTRNVGRAEGLPVLNPVDADGTFDHTVPRLTGLFVKDADRALIDDLAARGPARARAALRAQLPPLLALRHAAHLLGQDVVVRAHLRAARRDAARERDASTGTPSTSSTGASASGSRATSTGRCRATATGARRCPSGAAATRHDTCIGRVAELSRARRARPRRPRPAPPLRRRGHVPVSGRRVRQDGPPAAPGDRHVVRLGLDAVGAAPLPVRGTRAVRRARSRPTSSARRSTRPAAGSTRCSPSTRWCSTRRRSGTSCASA